MPGWAWVVIVLVVIAAIALAAWAATRRRRTLELQRRFGTEYDQVVGERGDRKEAEAQLAGRRERRESLDIRPLAPDARRRYADRWEATQAKFVDSPQLAVTEADVLVQSVMRDRGYPVEETGQRMELVSVDHPDVMDHFRAANRIAVAARQQRASTEDLPRGDGPLPHPVRDVAARRAATADCLSSARVGRRPSWPPARHVEIERPRKARP